MSKEKVFAVRCFIDGKRIKTHKLTKKQAKNFLIAANYLASYLQSEYDVKIKKNK